MIQIRSMFMHYEYIYLVDSVHMKQVQRRNLIFRYSKISSLTILGYWVKVETRVFDLFDLFFEDRIVDRKLINILSINFPKLPNREKENLEYPILQRMLHFRRLRKKKERKKRVDAMVFTYHSRWCWLRCYLRS